MPTREAVLEALSRVIDPELHRPVTELDMVRSIEIEGGRVDVRIALTLAGSPLRSSFEDQGRREVASLADVQEVTLGFDVMSADERQALTEKLRGSVSG